MSQPTPPNTENVVRVAQIIAGALVLGVLMFAGVAVAISIGKPAAARPVVTYVALVVAGMMIVARYFVPKSMASAQRRQAADAGTRGDAEEWTALGMVYQTKTIVAFALLEGAAFLCLIAYTLEAQWVALAMAGVLLLLMAAGFPTRGQFETWAEGQRQMMAFDRHEPPLHP